MHHLDYPAVLVTLAIGVLGGFTRGVSGFGAALVMVPLLSLQMATQQAVTLMVLTTFSTNLPLLISAHRSADRKALRALAGAGIVALPLGTWLLLQLASETLRVLAGAVVLSATAALLLFDRPRTEPLGLFARLLAGAASGLLNGAVGMGGPPVVLYFLAAGASAETSRASFIVYFSALQSAQLAMLASSGLIALDALAGAAVLAPAMLLGSYLGALAFRAGGHRYFRAVSLTLLALTGLAAVLR
jgi:uncharacterized protein